MVDIYDSAKRSAIMSRVRGTGNRSTEIRLVAIFRGYSISGWRRNQPLPGRPDFVFRRERLAVFVDGCFWHQCPIHGSRPADNASCWEEKLSANVVRDALVTETLQKMGWHVVRIWQHELTKTNEPRLVLRLRRALSA